MEMPAAAERDRKLWARPVLDRRQVRRFDPSEATTEEVLAFAMQALWVGDLRRALRLARIAEARDPGDGLAETIVVLVGVLRRLLCFRRPTDAQVAALRGLAQGTPFAVYGLVRALLWRKDVQGARDALAAVPPGFRDAPSVVAARALPGSAAECLEGLRRHREIWPPRPGLLHLEAACAALVRDTRALLDADAQRRLLRGRRPTPWLVRWWLRLRYADQLGVALLGVGLVLGWRWTLLLSLPIVALPILLEWRHLPRNRCAKVLEVILLTVSYGWVHVLFGYPTFARVVVGSIIVAGELESYASVHRKLRKIAAEAALGGGASEPLRGSFSAPTGPATEPQDAD